MKIMKTIILLFFSVLCLSAFSQEEMTIEQVFNFDIGDKYQYKSSLQDQPPNALTKEIIDKYYSPNSDTLFYIIHRTYYSSNYEMDPEPHLVYSFGDDTVTEQYTNLNASIFDFITDLRYDSIILHYETDFTYDSIIEYSDIHCNVLSNGFECVFPASAVEPNSYYYSFGNGLGISKQIVWDGSGAWNGPSIAKSLTFYSKGDETCGIMDNLTSNPKIETKTNIDIFPNPAKDYFQIIYDNLDVVVIELYDLTGALIKRESINGRLNQIDILYLTSGIYTLKINYNNTTVTRKIVKE